MSQARNLKSCHSDRQLVKSVAPSGTTSGTDIVLVPPCVGPSTTGIEHQTTNLGVRSSNLFGRAMKSAA
jgi:hypothetical protein